MNKIENGKTNGDELPEEMRLDYSKVKPNRFAAKRQNRTFDTNIDTLTSNAHRYIITLYGDPIAYGEVLALYDAAEGRRSHGLTSIAVPSIMCRRRDSSTPFH